MKNAVRLALALSALALAFPAAAQQQAARKQFGVGISIDPLVDFGPTVEVYVPIRIAPNFRIEPSLGIITNNPDGNDNNSSDITLGIGAFYVAQAAANADWYAGARLKLNFASQENPAPVGNQSDTDLILAGAFGGEYYLVPNFSLGLEAQLGLYQNGDVTGGGASESGWFTTGLGFVRFYF